MNANQTQRVCWLDDPNGSTPDGTDIGKPDSNGITWQVTLACELDDEVAGYDADDEVEDYRDLIARELARLARRVRASGCRTVAEFVALEP
jgi:hypothetical protein